MKQFQWSRKGETKWNDAEVELLLNDHTKHMVAEEVGPLKDSIKTLKAEQKVEVEKLKTEATTAATEVKTLKDENAALLGEVKPVRETALLSKRKELAKDIIKDEHVADALVLAGVEEGDDDDVIKSKLQKVAETRDFMKAVAETPEQKVAREAREAAANAAKVAQTELTPAQLAAIASGGNNKPPKAKTLEELAKEDVTIDEGNDGLPKW